MPKLSESLGPDRSTYRPAFLPVVKDAMLFLIPIVLAYLGMVVKFRDHWQYMLGLVGVIVILIVVSLVAILALGTLVPIVGISPTGIAGLSNWLWPKYVPWSDIESARQARFLWLTAIRLYPKSGGYIAVNDKLQNRDAFRAEFQRYAPDLAAQIWPEIDSYQRES